jgi:hypothetical protein
MRRKNKPYVFGQDCIEGGMGKEEQIQQQSKLHFNSK